MQISVHEPSNGIACSKSRLDTFPGFCEHGTHYVLWSVLLLWGVIGTSVAHAGRELNLSAPGVHAAYVAELVAESRKRKAEAVAWARQRGLPIRYENGFQVLELIAVWDDRPMYYGTYNVQAAISIGADRIRDLSPWNLDGDGFTLGLWDESFADFNHPEFQDASGSSRVMSSLAGEKSAHATHVAGTIGAAGIDPAARGLAPRVRILSLNWNEDAAMMGLWAAREPGQADKIYISNHSYGPMAGWTYANSGGSPERVGWHWVSIWDGLQSYEEWFGQYNEIANDWDAVAYLHPYYLAFTAAGNDRSDNPAPGETVYYWGGWRWEQTTYNPEFCPPGDGERWGGYDTIAGSAVAKNVITVGAVDDAVLEDTRALSKAAMPDFSGWGPTDDGRIKPDIVANGIGVYSTMYDPDDPNTRYESHDGTSMACPTATGSALLLVQYYDRLYPGQNMRASTLKGLIIHTADDLGPSGPDYQFGWGLMNATAAAELIQEHHDCGAGTLMIEDSLNEEDLDDVYYAHVTDNAPIRLTLCWTDPPAAGTTGRQSTTARRLINDLDLRLVGPDGVTVYRPFILHRDDPQTRLPPATINVITSSKCTSAAPASQGSTRYASLIRAA